MQIQTTIEPDLSGLNGELGLVSAQVRIHRAYEVFGEDLILATSFGPTAGVMLKLATEVFPTIRVITVRHGYEAPRTLEAAGRLTEELGLNLRIYEAPHVLIPDEGSTDFDDFKRRVKIEPFQKALSAEKPRAWMSGVMRSETAQRKAFTYAMFRDGLVAIYPILDWDEADAEEFSLAHGLHFYEGYYDPTKGQDQKKECGLHLGNLGTSWTASGL